jgi:uncharacterized protein YbdZ (MbtH family)
MSPSGRDNTTIYKVVMNERQYSIWPAEVLSSHA